MVPTADDRGSLRSGEEGIDFFVAQERDQRPVEAFRGNSKYPLDEGTLMRMAQGGEAEQGVDRGKPGVPGPGAVATFRLQIVEKRSDQRGVDILQVQR
jgi:hypothetical protein